MRGTLGFTRPVDLSPDDTNEYTYSWIVKHNLFISTLLGGQYGLSSATGVARDMIRSFTNVQIALMVDMGGGAKPRARYSTW